MSSLCSEPLSCMIPAALPLSFQSLLPRGSERHLGSRTVLAAHTDLATSLSATSISLLSGISSRQDHSTSVLLYHIPALPAPSPAVPKHPQSPTACAGVIWETKTDHHLPIKRNNNRHNRLWKKLLFNVQKVYIQVQHVTSILMM